MSKADINAIMDLKMVGYGNTHYSYDPTPSFECQHGQGECDTDALDLCVQYKLSGTLESIENGNTTKSAFPFILCMEKEGGDPTKGQYCFDNTYGQGTSGTVTQHLTWPEIDSCHTKEFNEVQLAAMKATPGHQYVPWVIVNGALLKNTALLQKAICDAYTGSDKPSSCSRSSEQVDVVVEHDFTPSMNDWKA